jgi:hypothetical protein
MIDCFVAVGVPEGEARTSAHVLIEADKRGIDRFLDFMIFAHSLVTESDG